MQAGKKIFNIEKVEKIFGVIKPSDWYNISSKQLKSQKITQNQLEASIKTKYPFFYLKRWLLPGNTSRFWQNKVNQRNMWLHSASKLNVKAFDDWYKIKSSLLHDSTIFRGSTGIMSSYNWSLQHALVDIFPEYCEFQYSWKFANLKFGFWNSLDNHKLFLKYLEKELNISNKEDWYKITLKSLKPYGGFYKQYKSMLELLKTNYPDYNWIPWKFFQVPKGFWNSIEAQQSFIKSIEQQENIKSPLDWYNVPTKNIKMIYRRYNSLIGLLQNIYPNIIWLPWKFKSVSPGCWEGRKGKYHIRLLFEYLSNPLEIKNSNQWYAVSNEDIISLGSISILNNYYGSNLFNCLTDIQPEVTWLAWRFNKVNLSFWDNEFHVFQFLKWCENHFQMKSLKDWEKITYEKAREAGGSSLLKKWVGVSYLIEHYYSKKNSK